MPGNRVDAISSTVPNVMVMAVPDVMVMAGAGSESRGNHVDAGQSRRCHLEYGAVTFVPCNRLSNYYYRTVQ